MTTNQEAIAKTCRQVADIMGEGPGADALAAQERDLVAAIQATRLRKPTARRLWPIAVAASIAAAAGILLGIGKYSQSRDAEFWVGAQGAPGRTGEWLNAGHDAPLLLVFDRGTAMTLDSESSAVVQVSTHDRATVELRRGRLNASVHGSPGFSWTVSAGPYRVLVTGTVFSVSWLEEGGGHLEVEVQKGAVAVEGPTLPPGGQRVAAAQHLRVAKGRLEITAASTPVPSAGASALAPAPSPALRKPTAIPSPAGPRVMPMQEESKEAAVPMSRGMTRVSELANLGLYRAAHDEAVRDGLYDKLNTLATEDVWQLAEIARYAGRAAGARAAYEALRLMHPQSEQARRAAFFLGWVALELDKAPVDAAPWLELYLASDPHAVLREEALGKLMKAYREAGRDEASASTAKTYLASYPEGIYAEFARAILEH